MTSLATLKVGGSYTMADFDIKSIRQATHIVEGQVCMFFRLGSKMHNQILDDGSFVWEARNPDTTLVPQGQKIPSVRYVFIRKKGNQTYTYYGQSLFEERYSATQDKLYFT